MYVIETTKEKQWRRQGKGKGERGTGDNLLKWKLETRRAEWR